MSSNKQTDKTDHGNKVQDSEDSPLSQEQQQEQSSSGQSRSASSPIDIKQVQGGKFGVLHVRQPADPLADGINGEPVPIEKIIKTANTMSNMMMAHKIALEDDFKLEPGLDISGPLMSLSPIIGSSPSSTTPSNAQAGEPSLQTRVKDIVLEAYWNLIKEELDSHSSEKVEDRKFNLSKQLICDIKQKITDLLLPQHARLKNDIEDRLDLKILDQLVKVKSLNLVDYANYILSVLSELCAPIRDEKLKELRNTTDVVQLYRGIMELLESMRLDFANFTLNRFKPHIKAHSLEYEREKFNEILQQQRTIGIDGLEYTRMWLDRAVKRVDSIHGISDLLADASELRKSHGFQSCSSDTATPRKKDLILSSEVVDKVLNSAYCELLEWTPQTQRLYPETLLFDEATFKQLGNQYLILLLTSSTLLASFAFINKFKLQDDQSFKALVKSHVITLLTASYNESIALVEPSAERQQPSPAHDFDRVKLETVATKVCDDIRQRLQQESNLSLLEQFETQKDILKGQILELQNSSNRIRELARRRILEFIETLLVLDVKHQQKKFASSPPPVNIPLGLNCLADEMTATMAQLVKIIRYNRRVFFQHYQDIIVELVSNTI